MLQNAYLVAKIGADTAENEQHSAEEHGVVALGDVDVDVAGGLRLGLAARRARRGLCPPGPARSPALLQYFNRIRAQSVF